MDKKLLDLFAGCGGLTYGFVKKWFCDYRHRRILKTCTRYI
ncbi:hypothetical protein ACXYRQ_03930 [Mycoplasma sp. 394]